MKELQQKIHTWAIQKGHWDDIETILEQVTTDDRDTVKGMVIAQKLALIHSEVTEILGGHRKDKWAKKKEYENDENWVPKISYEEYIKDSVEAEIAGTIIRLLDLAEYLGVDTQWYIDKEMEYNETRPYKHNKKY